MPTLKILALTSLAAVSLQADDAAATQWFPWSLAVPAKGSPLDASALNAASAGAKGFVSTQDGHFVDGAGERLRFWGVNLASAQAFPPDEHTAKVTADILAGAGVNIARLHHMDNNWGLQDGTSLWGKNAKNRIDIEASQLDKVHRLIAALKERGIYSNINLKVSKTLSAADGFPESVSKIPDFQKRIDFYNRRMIDLQKDFAKKLLTTVNPYTGLAPVNDPAVAVVEINNENSLLGFWTKNLGHGLGKFPVEFRNELIGLWNAWLTRHYADDNALHAAWAPATSASEKDLLDAKSAWSVGANPVCKASLRTLEGGVHEITVEKTDGIDWHVQSNHRNLQLEEGETYTLEIEVKGTDVPDFQTILSLDTDLHKDQSWRELGFRDRIPVTSEWTLIRRSFIATACAGVTGRLDLNLGQKAGTFSFKNLRLYKGSPTAGLQAGQSPSQGNVPMPESPSKKQWSDWIDFLADTEHAFAEEMRNYLRQDLGVKVPITVTQIDYAGLIGVWREQGSDFADSHAYWQHPDFGANTDWDASRWTIKNSPQLAEFSERNFQRFSDFAFYRIAGKPFTVSEYDHAAPSEFASEMYPTYSSFAALQDWDGIYVFDTGPFGTYDKDGRISAYFDNQHNPSKWAQAAFAARVFRQARVPAASATATLHLPEKLWSESHHADILWDRLVTGSFDFLARKYEVSDRPHAGATKSRVEISGTPNPGAIALATSSAGRVYTIDTPSAAAIVGFLGGTDTQAGVLAIKAAPFGRNFASLTASTPDQAPLPSAPSVLITLVGRSENTGMVWNASRTSIGKNWGHGPVLTEFIPARISLKTDGARRVFTLAPDGTRVAELKASYADGWLSFETDPKKSTLHFEVVR